MNKALQFVLAVVAVTALVQAAETSGVTYPAARKSDQADNYHGVRVPDPYRWLEDDRSQETEAWVRAENEVTAEYFNRIPYRRQLRSRLEQLQNYARYTTPFRRGEYYFFTKNDGLQNQNIVYFQKGLSGAPQVFLDPNRFSKDGTSRLGVFEVSKAGTYAGYTISTGGSDWQEGHVIEVATGKVLPDRLNWLKATGLAWAGDGFFYSRYPAPVSGHELSSKNENQTVYFHRVGTDQADDRMIFEDKTHPQRFNNVATTEDERYAFLEISDRGTGKDGNALFYRDLSRPGKDFVPIVSEISESQYSVIDNVDGSFLVQTNAKAPNSRIALYDPSHSTWKDVIPEKRQPLRSATYAGGKLFTEYVEDVASRVYVYRPDGHLESEVKLPGSGVAGEVAGNHEDKFVFYSFSSLNIPGTIYRYDIGSGKSEVLHSPDIPGFDPAKYESKEIFYKSKDGTRIPMFVVHRKGLKLDGTNPTLLYAYGGFNIISTPAFSALRLALLEQGFVFASANIRGGGEYGESWHEAGMRFHKQNVFDDYIAAAEWLIASRYTSKDKLAIQGVSNGGLLIGAVINQRPDLFRVAIAQAGVMDMLRFQKFTIGWNWIADYGSSDDPQQFKNLYAYSPLHNIQAGRRYPATLITTADHDDRVVPGHSFKYAATLQASASHENPVLIRIDTNSGHGPSSTKKQLEQTTDIFAFIFQNLGVTPDYATEGTRARSMP